jgi:hypothetical protein
LPLKFIPVILLLARLCFISETAAAEEFALSFKISHDGVQLVPGAPATLTLTVAALDGRSSSGGWVIVRLDAPSKGVFFSTDFPVVEGSRLLELRLPIIDGQARWRQVFPIRGDYRLAAQIAGAASAKTEKIFTLHVHENDRKWLVLGGFVLGLFVIGVIAGRIFSAPRNNRTVNLGLSLVLSITYCAATGDSAWAQQDHKRKYLAKIEVASPTVGTPARVRWWLQPAGVEGMPSAKLAISIMHLEKNTVVFAVENIPVAGEFSFDYQFVDGSEHRMSAVAVTDDGETIRQEQTVSVTAVAPPSRAQLAALALFLFVIFLGLLVGRRSRRASVRVKVR